MKKNFAAAIIFAGLIGSTSMHLQAAPVVFQATDPGASSNTPLPASTAAAAAFDAAVAAVNGTLTVLDFEATPLGAFSSLVLAPGVTVSGQAYSPNLSHSVSNQPSCSSLCGFNTTIGGSRFLDVIGNSITFTFDTGIFAFGAFITGVQFAGETVNFNDGTSQTITLTEIDGGAHFVGFTDVGKEITSIVIDTRGNRGVDDFLGIDDVRFAVAAVEPPAPGEVPEPGSLALVGLGVAGLAAVRRRKRA